ncbi:SRPBCC family protein [Solimonas sp. K1W22B-7]|uniref:SRPBCC family protein n=1 Tax=Solimonas sp. K1W22B-7 TaxID=2303331 RepID=UPI000E332EBC|nr:SRPBCC family protein [Solimonas sp. K1W22B-7]AXQ28040.1 SRPBCC family protein [Solimonas sp. K1W22B-7]
MPRYEVRLAETVNAPLSEVFDFFADHERFTTLFGSHCMRIREGELEANGIGSVRRIGSGRSSFDETIVAFEPNRRIDYQVTRGSPIKNHLGQILFTSDNGRTQIDYVIRFDPKIPCTGKLLVLVLRAMWKRNAPQALKGLERA